VMIWIPMTANDRLDTRLPIGFATHPKNALTGTARAAWRLSFESKLSRSLTPVQRTNLGLAN
jgi:hypothetical protein